MTLLGIIEIQGNDFPNQIHGNPAPDGCMESLPGFNLPIPLFFQLEIIIPVPPERDGDRRSPPIHVIHGDINTGRLAGDNHPGADASGHDNHCPYHNTQEKTSLHKRSIDLLNINNFRIYIQLPKLRVN